MINNILSFNRGKKNTNNDVVLMEKYYVAWGLHNKQDQCLIVSILSFIYFIYIFLLQNLNSIFIGITCHHCQLSMSQLNYHISYKEIEETSVNVYLCTYVYRDRYICWCPKYNHANHHIKCVERELFNFPLFYN